MGQAIRIERIDIHVTSSLTHHNTTQLTVSGQYQLNAKQCKELCEPHQLATCRASFHLSNSVVKSISYLSEQCQQLYPVPAITAKRNAASYWKHAYTCQCCYKTASATIYCQLPFVPIRGCRRTWQSGAGCSSLCIAPNENPMAFTLPSIQRSTLASRRPLQPAAWL